MKKSEPRDYILGLDLGANSIGWAILPAEAVEKDGRLQPDKIGRTGVRVFEAGVEGDIESGKDESRNLKRREARSHRRQLERRVRRLTNLFHLLQNAKLLPQDASGGDSSPTRDQVLDKLDQDLFAQWKKKLEAKGATKEELRLLGKRIPYLLRAQALDEKLEPFDLGRAFYQLAQRRGFLSNRKATKKKDDDKGQVKQAIGELAKKIEETGARTLGEYFSRINPEEERIRSRWTARQMFADEFEKIWTAQSRHYPEILTDDFKKQVHHAIFHQRPLKIQHHLIGKCEWEKNRKRAPMAILPAQRFRLLQQVNHTTVTMPHPDGEIRPLSPEERASLIAVLETQGDLKFKAAKKIIGLPQNCTFNFESGGEERFLGNRTAAKLIKVFGENRWQEFSERDRDRIVEDSLSISKEEALARRALKVWGLSGEKAEEFADLELEPGYARLSRQALRKLLPLLEQGKAYMEAAHEIYGDRPPPQARDFLPPVLDKEALSELRNPIVHRALTELRKVVNAIIREHGKPAQIRIELARDLKKTRKQREQIWKKNRQNQKGREKAAEQIIREAGIQNPTRADKEKYLLWEECCRICPYTGKTINISQLLGPTPQFDVEHIIPFSRCLDDSFFNKTLCEHEENRSRKREKTPWEAYGAHSEKWEEIIQRVKRFQGEAAQAKLERFLLKDLESLDDFATRQLNDTRYAAKEAKKFLGLLYGEESLKRVQAGRGQITAYLRNEWDLNRILSDGGDKSRDDHRHHAVDAVCIALTDPGTVHALSKAASRAFSERRRRFGRLDPPWPNFYEQVKESVGQIIVSHRVSRKVNGPLHEETFYSPPRLDEKGKSCVHVRKRLEALTAKDIEVIVDPVVRQRVQTRLQELGGGDPKKLFAIQENLPWLETGDGRKIPIKKARIKKSLAPFKIGESNRERYAATDSNHHVEIIEVKDQKGKVKWEGQIVSQMEAMRRLRAKESVIKRDHGEGKTFVLSLSGGEVIEIDEENKSRGLYVIRTLTTVKQGGHEYPNLYFVLLNDARKIKEIKSNKDLRTALLEPLRKLNCRKVMIDPLGEVRKAND